MSHIHRTGNLLVSLFLLLCLAACSATEKTAVERDGTSFEKAIVAPSIRFEYDWVAEHYPGASVSMQELAFRGRKPFDILTVRTPDGKVEKVFFDISGFYWKW